MCVCGWEMFKGTPMSRCLSGLVTIPGAFIPLGPAWVCAVDVSSNLYLGWGGNNGKTGSRIKRKAQKSCRERAKGHLRHVQMCAAFVQWRHKSVRGAIYFII